MKKEKAKRITLYIDSDVYLNFKMYSIIIGTSVSELVEKYMIKMLGEKNND